MTGGREPQPGPLKLDSPLLVQWEYASEERLAVRNQTYRELLEGTNADDVIVEAVREVAPGQVLEVGSGIGELADRIKNELGASVCAVDISPRMVALTAERGIDAIVADAQELPFDDCRFDCEVAAWVLYHVPDLDRAVGELARVLKPGGRLVASTVGEENLSELWEAIGDTSTRTFSFGATNGADVLERHFPRVERRDAHGTVVFPTRDAIRRFVAATITRAHLSDRVPETDKPFRASTYHAVFVADKA